MKRMGAQKAQIGFRQPDNPSVICFANATSLYTREAIRCGGDRRPMVAPMFTAGSAIKFVGAGITRLTIPQSRLSP